MYEKNNTDNYTLLQKIESGIVNDIDNSNKKDEILKKICGSETELSLYGSETSSIIKNVISNKKIVQNVTSNDVNNSNILLSSLELINVINNIKTELGINNNEGVGNNAYYDLFKGIATGISDNNMEELKTKIKEECDEDNNQDLFIFTLTEISKYSTYKMNQDNLGTLNEAFSKQNGEFMISKNNKLYYSTNKSEYDNESINNEVSNNLDRLMDLINTNFIMKNSEYNMLSNIASLISTDNFNRIISNTTLLDNNVKSASEFSKIITSIANGEIFRKQQNDNIGGQLNNEELKNKMNKITVERIKELYKKQKDKQLSKEEESELDYYRKECLPSLRQKEKNNNVPLDQREQDILNYENELEEEQNPIPTKKDNDNVTKYNITGITDKLSNKGLYIESMEAVPSLPANVQVITMNDMNGLLNSGAGKIAMDGRIKSVPGLFRPVDRFCRTVIGQIINKKIDSSIEKEFLKPENNYLIVEIKALEK